MSLSRRPASPATAPSSIRPSSRNPDRLRSRTTSGTRRGASRQTTIGSAPEPIATIGEIRHGTYARPGRPAGARRRPSGPRRRRGGASLRRPSGGRVGRRGPHGDRRRHRPHRVPAGDFRARDLRRLLRSVVGDAGAAYASHVGDERHFLGDRGRRAACRRRAAGHARDRLRPIKGGSLFEVALGVAIGAITFTGSIIAGAKLNGNMSGKPIMLPQRHALNIGLAVLLVLCIAWLIGAESRAAFWLVVLVSFVLGVTLIIPIGGADMPVVVSMLNSYSGWAAAGIGFTLGNLALIITGSLVGSSGAILSYIMCKGMNRSFISVILGGFGGEVAGPAGAVEARPVKQG